MKNSIEEGVQPPEGIQDFSILRNRAMGVLAWGMGWNMATGKSLGFQGLPFQPKCLLRLDPDRPRGGKLQVSVQFLLPQQLGAGKLFLPSSLSTPTAVTPLTVSALPTGWK